MAEAVEAKTRSAEDIFKEFKEHSISEFFRKNSQMLGFSGRVRSMTTLVHEYVTNSLDAAEEASILPEISVEVREISEGKYYIRVSDNGPGIPRKHVGKALGVILAGTKFARYMQQRGQQGIGAAGCTMYALVTTGKPVHVVCGTSKDSYECDLSLDIKSNRPVVTNMKDMQTDANGMAVSGEFGDLKYEMSDHGVYEYLRRTALANPHASIRLIDPEGKESLFPRSVNEMPKRPKLIKPHPLGIGTSDLLDFTRATESRRLSSFLTDTFARFTPNQLEQLKQVPGVKEMDWSRDPRTITWQDAERLVNAFKQIKWIAPDLDSLSTIGEQQIEIAIKNIINPQFVTVIERKPVVFRGGIPFVVEAGIAYGGNAGRKTEQGVGGNVLRYANKVPLLFDTAACAITEATKGVEWKRYSIQNFDEEPVSVFVNVSSVYIPYSGVGKQAIAQEEEIVYEIKLAVMDAARRMQRYLSGMRSAKIAETRYNAIMRYVSQLSGDLGDITGEKRDAIEAALKDLIEKRYKKIFEEDSAQ